VKSIFSILRLPFLKISFVKKNRLLNEFLFKRDFRLRKALQKGAGLSVHCRRSSSFFSGKKLLSFGIHIKFSKDSKEKIAFLNSSQPSLEAVISKDLYKDLNYQQTFLSFPDFLINFLISKTSQTYDKPTNKSSKPLQQNYCIWISRMAAKRLGTK